MKKYLLLSTILLTGSLWLSHNSVTQAGNFGHNMFTYFTTWTSGSLNSSSYYSFLVNMPLGGVNVSNGSQKVNGQKWIFQDLNGDALSDFLYRENYYDGSHWHQYLALFFNNGNGNFDLVYKCVGDNNTYYGNCVSGAPQTYEPNMISEVYEFMGYSRFQFPTLLDPSVGRALADLNGNGFVDIIIASHFSTPGQILWNPGTWNL